MGKIIDKTIDRMLDVFFSKDKTRLYVLCFFVLGFILRLFNVLNSPTSIDASGHAVHAINFISSGKLGTWSQSAGLWHFLTDISYKLFGIGDFGARFMVLLFGSLSIIAIFLFTREMFNERIGLIAAFLLAVSPWHIVETIPEMDVVMMFFVLMGMLLFVKGLKQNKRRLFIFSGIFIGLGVITKIYAVLFLPVLLLYYLYYIIKYKPGKDEKKILKKSVLVFLVAVFVFLIIPLTYNYLLYKDKGIVDLTFADTLGIRNEKSDQYYGWVAPYVHEYKAFFLGGSEKIAGKLPTWIYTIKYLYNDLVVLILGVLGLFVAFKRKNKDYLFMFLFMLSIVFFYMGTITALMSKHYLFELFMFVPLAAVFLDKIATKKILKFLLILILIFQLFWVFKITEGHFYEKSAMNQLVSYKMKNIPESSLVVFDSRIFRGLGTYMFADKHYLESNYFAQVMNTQEQFPGNYQLIETYFIECVSDDCGWGTVAGQPEFNQSMEQIVDFFKENGVLVAEIYESREKKSLSFSYNIYKTNLQLKPQTLQVADSTHTFFLYPVGYDERITEIFDDYNAHGVMDKFIDGIAHWILWFAVFASIISIPIVFYLIVHEDEKSGLESEISK